MPNKGYKLTEEQKSRMSKAQKKRYLTGRPWNYDQKWDLHVKQNISEGMKRYWAQMHPEKKKELVDNLIARNPSIIKKQQ